MSKDVQKSSKDVPKGSVSHEHGKTKENELISGDFPY